MALVVEPAVDGECRNRLTTPSQLAASPLEAESPLQLPGGDPIPSAERPSDVGPRHSRLGRQCGEIEPFGQAVLEQVPDAPQPAWGATMEAHRAGEGVQELRDTALDLEIAARQAETLLEPVGGAVGPATEHLEASPFQWTEVESGLEPQEEAARTAVAQPLAVPSGRRDEGDGARRTGQIPTRGVLFIAAFADHDQDGISVLMPGETMAGWVDVLLDPDPGNPPFSGEAPTELTSRGECREPRPRVHTVDYVEAVEGLPGRHVTSVQDRFDPHG